MDDKKHIQSVATNFVMELPYFLGKLEHNISSIQARKLHELISGCDTTKVNYIEICSLKNHIEILLNEYSIKANRNTFNPYQWELILDDLVLSELINLAANRFLDYVRDYAY
jgi:hypothetical protein